MRFEAFWFRDRTEAERAWFPSLSKESEAEYRVSPAAGRDERVEKPECRENRIGECSMCGIIGYIGKKQALPVILDGLKRMEYRGYDSAGCVVFGEQGAVQSEKAVGKIAALETKLNGKNFSGTVACGHTRWATHGGVTESNAHPHRDCKGTIWVVHNGIIENYKELKTELLGLGHSFASETDTEVISHCIEEIEKKSPGIAFSDAVRLALGRLRGTYGLLVVHAKFPDTLIAARNFSPLLFGIGNSEYIVASDAAAILRYTSRMVYLNDGEMAILKPDGYEVYDLGKNVKPKHEEEIEWTIDEAEKGGYPHFMLKEIYEEPEAIENSIRGRLVVEDGMAKLGGLAEVSEKLKYARRILISGCGTAYYAGKVGEYMIEEYAGVPVEVDLASEFRYRKPVFHEGDICLVVSQSGETADTLAAIREAKGKGVLTLGIVNVVGSSIARETDAGVYQHIGPEIGVASTKAFVSHVAILALLTILLGRSRDMSLVTGRRIAEELSNIPSAIKKILGYEEKIKQIAERYVDNNHFLYIGRKYNMPIAYEGALKLKEIAYVHAEGYGAGELKHGPIAMIDNNFPTIAIAPRDSVYEKMISNIQEIKARKGPVIVVATEGDHDIESIADDTIYIPKTLEMLTPILSVIPLQLFAYYVGVLRGHDVDKPRNLAKSVTVE